MIEFSRHTVESAPDEAKPILEGVQNALGFVPNLIGYMADAPALVQGYTTLSGIFEKTSFSPTERQIILLTVSRENSCHYCMAAHTSMAQMQKVSSDVIRALRDGTSIGDPKLEALRVFTEKLVERRGYADQADIEAFLAAGYTQQNILEVVLGIGLKTLSNYTNHIVETEVDDAFTANTWQGR